MAFIFGVGADLQENRDFHKGKYTLHGQFLVFIFSEGRIRKCFTGILDGGDAEQNDDFYREKKRLQGSIVLFPKDSWGWDVKTF